MSRNVSASTLVPATRDLLLVAGLHGIGLLLLVLHIYVRTLPPTPEPIPTPTDAEAAWWGLWPVTMLPTRLVLVRRRHYDSDTAMGVELAQRAIRQSFPSIARLAAGMALCHQQQLLMVTFYLFPIVHTRWGDAYILTQAIAWPDPALRLTHSWQAPLDLFLHSQVWLALGGQNSWQDAMPVYHLLSPLAGRTLSCRPAATCRRPRPCTWLADLWAFGNVRIDAAILWLCGKLLICRRGYLGISLAGQARAART